MRSTLSFCGKPEPSAISWCCAITSMAPADNPMRLPCATPRATCSRYSAWSAAAALWVGIAHPLGELELAHVVQQRTHAHVEHLALAEAEHAAHQQRDHRHVEGVRGGAVGLHLGQHADAQLAIDHHLAQQRTGQRLGGLRARLRACWARGRPRPSTTWRLRCTGARTRGSLRAARPSWTRRSRSCACCGVSTATGWLADGGAGSRCRFRVGRDLDVRRRRGVLG